MPLSALCLAFATLLQPPAAKPQPPEMKAIDWLVGEWKGTGWIQMGPQKTNFTIREKIERKLEGQVFFVEGLGQDDGGRTIHQALAFFHYDHEAKQHRVKAFRKDGGYVDAKGELKDGAFVWGFADSRGPTVRFTLRQNEKGQWNETGDVTLDQGQTWRRFLEMTLERVK